MKKIVISLLVAGAAVAANAQDKALLETLANATPTAKPSGIL